MDLRDHLAHQSQSIGDEEHLLLNIHDDHLLSKLDQELNRLRDVVELEEILFLLQIEEDLADNDSEGEVKHLVIELFHVELEILRENSLQELDEIFYLDQVDEVVLEVLAAVKYCDQEVLEH